MKLGDKLINNKFEYFILFLFASSTLWLKEINYLFMNKVLLQLIISNLNACC